MGEEENLIGQGSQLEETEKKSTNKVLIIALISLIAITIITIPVYFFVLPKIITGNNQSQENLSAISGNASINCTENWNCTKWSACSNETQKRDCTDLNNCTTTNSKPKITQPCAICEEKWLSERGCKNEDIIQRKYQLKDCTTEWREIYRCGELKCDGDQNSTTFAQCREYKCSELGGRICSPDQNVTCTNNQFEGALDSDYCCLTNCTNSTA